MDTLFRNEIPDMDEDSVEQMLALAERLREANGGALDESAIQAVAEATGAPIEYVRLAVKLRAEKQKTSVLSGIRAQFLTLNSETRRYVQSGVTAAFSGLFLTIERAMTSVGQGYGLFGMFAHIGLFLALYNVTLARDSRTATIAGGIFGGGFMLTRAMFSFLMQSSNRPDEFLLIPFTLIGALVGLAAFKIADQNRVKLGLKDPIKDRQDLLRQLVDLQDKLKSGEQAVTFLSIDVVGSTRMKEVSDTLAVEFTFNEYHQYVDRITRKHGGRIHSTAGDGVICAFESPSAAYGAAKNIQAELIELNTFKNKLPVPIVLRAGIHTGNVVAPDATDMKSLNFAHVIDMAAHLQKVCPPGGIVVSEAAGRILPGGLDAVGADRVEAFDIRAAVWQPRQVLMPQAGLPPSVPEMG